MCAPWYDGDADGLWLIAARSMSARSFADAVTGPCEPGDAWCACCALICASAVLCSAALAAWRSCAVDGPWNSVPKPSRLQKGHVDGTAARGGGRTCSRHSLHKSPPQHVV
jgi:hypothetical protein